MLLPHCEANSLCHWQSIIFSSRLYCSVIATSETKATVTAYADGNSGFPHHDTVHGTYISLSFPCLPHVKWNDPNTLVRAGGTCVTQLMLV